MLIFIIELVRNILSRSGEKYSYYISALDSVFALSFSQLILAVRSAKWY